MNTHYTGLTAPATRLILRIMGPERTVELVAKAERAIARKDGRALRIVIASLRGEVSPRLILLAIAAAQALDAGDAVRALQYWDPFAEACRAAQASSAPL